MSKYVFIGSSMEGIEIAESVQIALSYEEDLEVVCWNQGVFQIGNYPLEDLFTQLNKSSFGIFVFSPDDFIEVRGEEYRVVRDNVLLELGMFYGALGKNRTFFIVPNNKKYSFKIPSDLNGLTIADYTYTDTANINYEQAVGTACTKIKRKIREIDEPLVKECILGYDFFARFDGITRNELSHIKTLTTCYIHSRRWRESNVNALENFLSKKNVKWNMLLPDIESKELIYHLKIHFSDGLTMVPKIIDAYEQCLDLIKKYGDKISVYLYSLYPTYSFYQFDDKMLVSFYTLNSFRKETPTLLLNLENGCNSFFKADVVDTINCSRKVDYKSLEKLIKQNYIPQ